MKEDSWKILSAFQESKPKGVQCHICPHECIIAEGKRGLCQTRGTVDGQLYTFSYGNPCSISVDPIEKKPLFHFYPGEQIFSFATGGCNFRCLNCQNWQISQTSPDEIARYEMSPAEVVREAGIYQTKMIAFTYTEPTVFYEYVRDTARLAHEKGLKTVYISNGYINKEPLLELCPYLDAANIDLKCFDERIYKRLTGGRLQPVLDTLLTLKEHHIWLEITNLLIPGMTNEPELVEKMCNWLVENGFSDYPIHFSRFFPNYKLTDVYPTREHSLMLAKEIAEKSGMKYVYIGNDPLLEGENTICPECKKMLVERTGYRVTKNHIQSGKCEFCGAEIAGMW